MRMVDNKNEKQRECTNTRAESVMRCSQAFVVVYLQMVRRRRILRHCQLTYFCPRGRHLIKNRLRHLKRLPPEIEVDLRPFPFPCHANVVYKPKTINYLHFQLLYVYDSFFLFTIRQKFRSI